MSTALPSLRSLFEAVRELQGAARADFLVGVDEAQRRPLERLLAADDGTGDGVLGFDAADIASLLDEPEPPPLPVTGQRIGSWQLLALIGEGGSSTVFHAARVHAGVRQKAALKLLRRGLYTAEAQRQFRHERQALAQLHHPDIARLIEGGITESGLAYIALELVEGTPITVHARTRNLDLRARLRLFLRVCRAVEAAHRALIVHRDLKPSNVLVSADGHVKLLDFGIAKLLDADDETQPHLSPFTPAYAAPEQRNNGQITTATDVYALGILLGELLTGKRLNDAGRESKRAGQEPKCRGGHGWPRAAREGNGWPRAAGSGRTPSGRIDDSSAPGVLPATPRITRRLLRGDLDNILLKATDDEAELRYTSAGTLAEDIERVLDGRLVAAHPLSRWYRVRKFVLRHRGGVAVTALFAVVVLSSLGLALWQANVARQEAVRANTVRDFLVGLFDTARAHLPRDQRPTPEQLVGRAQQRLDSESLDAATRADVLRTLGEVNLSLANFSGAEALLREAAALAARTGDTRAAQHARVLHADALQNAGRNEDAARELNAELAALRAAPSPDLLRALDVLAQAEMARGSPDAAIAHEREAVAAAAQLFGTDDVETVAAVLEVGNGLAAAQRFPEAIAELEPALARWRAIGAAQDDRYVAALASLAAAADGMGDSAKSEARQRDLLALKQRIYVAPHVAIAATLRELALIVGRDGARDAEAQALLDQALAMQRQIFGTDHAEIAETHEARGNVLISQRRIAEAEAAYREALAVCERAALKSEVCPRARNDFGMAYYREEKLDAAEAEMTQALADRRALFGDDHPTVAYSLSTLANVAQKRKEKARAVELAAEAVTVIERSGRGGSREAVMLRNSYASALWWADRNAEALPEIERTLADWQRVAPEGKPRRLMMLVLKAQILDDLKRPDEARKTAEEAIALDVPGNVLPELTKKLLRDLSGRADVYAEAPLAATK